MHEVAIAQGILEVVLDVAQDRHARAVRVRAGDLQGISQDSLQFCFEMVAQETTAASARLEVEIVEGDGVSVEAIELDDGWHFRPGAPREATT